jgi:DNA-damage-inducible protein D
MKTELIHSLTNNFEAHAQRADNGVEFWLARDIQHLLGYTKWDNFLNVVSKAKTSCDISGHPVADHFADVGKTIAMPKGAEKEVPDIMPKTATQKNRKSPLHKPTLPSRPVKPS